MRAYDVNLLADAVADMATIASVTGAEFKGPVMLPTRRKLYCVLRSPHVNKDAREHFEVRTHHRWVAADCHTAAIGV
jgi:small subunit ribosomal protein S10